MSRPPPSVAARAVNGLAGFGIGRLLGLSPLASVGVGTAGAVFAPVRGGGKSQKKKKSLKIKSSNNYQRYYAFLRKRSEKHASGDCANRGCFMSEAGKAWKNLDEKKRMMHSPK